MKIRTDFITNSSSSSYVIARKNDCTVEDIYNLINKNENIETIKASWGFEDENKNPDEILRKIAQTLFSNDVIKLDDWNVHSEEFGNENGFIESVIYDGLHIDDNDKFKMRGFC